MKVTTVSFFHAKDEYSYVEKSLNLSGNSDLKTFCFQTMTREVVLYKMSYISQTS